MLVLVVRKSVLLAQAQGLALVMDYQASKPFDLVICQGVLPYLSPPDLQRALHNLGRLSRGALYVEAVAREDYERDIIDDELTDPRMFRHRAALYRRGLAEHFTELGGGVFDGAFDAEFGNVCNRDLNGHGGFCVWCVGWTGAGV